MCVVSRIAGVLAAALLLAACSSASAPRHDRIHVVTTFSTLNSFVQGVGGKRVQVDNLVPVGASPETYQPTPQDIAKVADAQLVVENGAGIDAWIAPTMRNASNPSVRTLVLSQGMPVRGNNPHLWMDPVYGQQYVDKVRDALTAMDPQHASQYRKNAAAYNAKLQALQRSIAHEISARIPPAHRAMIIFHNAFDYYNRRFGIQTVGVIELSAGQDPNPQYIGQLIDLARAHHVRAVFSEPEYSPKLAQALAHSAGIRVISSLYDDSIGNDPRVHDYISMLTYDTNTIVQALK